MDQIDCIYLIGCEANTLVKIGRSNDVQARFAALRTMSPVKLTVLWQTLGGAELETALHRRFESCRSHGEWFDFPDGDAVAQVVQALPEVAAEMQRVQREQVARQAQEAKAAKAALEADAKEPREVVARRIYNDYMAEHHEVISNAKLRQALSEAGHPTGNRTAADLLVEFKAHPLHIAS